jgi:hypothetical protein
MKIKFLSRPRAGEVSHAEKSQATQLLIDAGLVQLIPDAPPALPVPRWDVGTGMSGRAHVRCQSGHHFTRVEIYDGPPQHLVAAFKKIGLDVPADIATRYAARFTRPTNLAADEVEVARAIRHGALDNQHK